MRKNNLILPDKSLSGKIIRNTAYNTLGRLWGIIVAVFLTPYTVSHIGIERFGVWALIGVITGYFGLLDFGIGASFVKYIVEFYTKKEFDKLNQLVNTGFVFYSVFTVIIVASAFFFMDTAFFLFKIPAYLHKEGAFVLLMGIFIFAGSNAFGLYSAVQSGLQRMDITNKVSIAMSFINIAGTIFFLEKGYGLPGLMVNNAIIFIVSSAINFIIAFKILPELKFDPRAFNTSMFEKLFKFGFKMQVARISGMITGQMDKVLIAYFLSIGMVTFFHLGNSVVYYAVSFCGLFISALMPAFSEIEAHGNKQKLIEAYLRSTKYLAFFVAPIFIFLFISASNIIFIWMGTGYSKSIMIIQILTVGYIANTLAQVASLVCVAINKPQLLATGSVIIIVSNLILSVAFIKLFGFMGAAWGSMIALNIGTFYFLSGLHKTLAIPVKKLVRKIVPYFISGILAAGLVCAMDLIVDQLGRNFPRVVALMILFARGVIFAGVYVALVYFGKLFDSYDLDFLRQKFPLFNRLK